MLPRERVLAAVMGTPWDRVPTGELGGDSGTAAELRCDCTGVNLEDVPAHGKTRELRSSGLFIWGIVNGPFMRLVNMMGWDEALIHARDPSLIRRLADEVEALLRATRRVQVHGIVVCDDVAHSGGPFFSGDVFERSLFPAWTTIVEVAHSLGHPAFLHSDGAMEALIRGLVDCRFDGIHGLDSEAGVDVARIRSTHGDSLCLMGGLSLSQLFGGPPSRTRVEAKKLCIAGGNRYVFGTSSGFLTEWTPVDALTEAYEAARQAYLPVSVRFIPGDSSARVSAGSSVLDAARSAGVAIDSACGGHAKCRRCLVEVVSGDYETVADDAMTNEAREHAHASDRHLACLTRIYSDAVVQVPASTPATTGPVVLRTNHGEASSQPGQHRAPCNHSIVAARQGPVYGMAIDIGTTTIAASLVDMDQARVLRTETVQNPQRAFGADVVSRLSYAIDGGQPNLSRLRDVVLQALHGLAFRFTDDPLQVAEAVIVGNPVMIHLLLGLRVDTLAVAPFEPVTRSAMLLTAADVGLPFHSKAQVLVPPSIGGFVGADAVAGAVATGTWRSDEWRLTVDLGTNGEVILGRHGTIFACSTAAGPAFEGVGLTCGMPAIPGAISSVWVEDNRLAWNTIGDAEPLGICGSGLIDLLAILLEAGVLLPTGRLLEGPAPLSVRVVPGHDELGLTLLSGAGNRIYLGQRDIRHLQLAKSAIRSSIDIALSCAAIPETAVSVAHLTGSFGSSLNPRNAIGIGLLPPGMALRTVSSGNAALAGATLILLDKVREDEALALASAAVHLELASSPEFQERFVANLSLSV